MLTYLEHIWAGYGCMNAVLINCYCGHVMYLWLEFMYWINKSSHGPEKCWGNYSLEWSWNVWMQVAVLMAVKKYGWTLISQIAVSIKFLKGSDCHQGKCWHWEPGLWMHCCDVFCHMLAVGLSVIGWHFICQVGYMAICKLWDLLGAFWDLNATTF